MLILVYLSSPALHSLDTAFIQKVKSEQEIAYEEISSGKWRDGMKRLIYLFREMPANDVECVDVMISPMQLFIFAVHQYMGGAWGRAGSEKGEMWQIEDFGNYPTDKLVSSLITLSDESMIRYAGFVKLYGLSKSEHQGVRLIASAICTLMMPREYFKEDPVQFSVHTIKWLKEYPYLNVVKQISLLPLLQYINEQYIRDIKSEKYFYERVWQSISMYWGGAVIGIGKDIPSLGCMVDKMAELEKKRTTIELGVQNLAQSILEEKDSVCQYGQLVLLIKLVEHLKWEDKVRDTLEELIRRTNKSDAVNVRAKLCLVYYLQKTHDVKRMRELSREILDWDILPGVIDINLYERQLYALQSLGRYFTRYGWYDEAKVVYNGIAKKYSLSKAGRDAESWAKQIESHPVDASLEMIAGKVEGFRVKGELDKVKAYYRDIAEHTPNADLLARMEAQQKNCSEKLQYTRKPNEMEEWLQSVRALADPNTPPSVRNEILQKMTGSQYSN